MRGGARPTCGRPDCGQPHKAKGLCQRHYDQARTAPREARSRKPRLRRVPPTPLERLAAKTVLAATGYGGTPCCIYTGAKTYNGYGLFQVAGVRFRVHRWVYELLVGPIPAGLVIDHLCRERACVNVAHLEVVTVAENTRRGDSLWGLNARKTHCLNDHPFDQVNTYVAPDGSRHCRTCRNQWPTRSTGEVASAPARPAAASPVPA